MHDPPRAARWMPCSGSRLRFDRRLGSAPKSTPRRKTDAPLGQASAVRNDITRSRAWPCNRPRRALVHVAAVGSAGGISDSMLNPRIAFCAGH